MSKTNYIKFTGRKKREDRVDRLSVGAAVAFMGVVLLIVAVIVYADAAEWGYVDSLTTAFWLLIGIGVVDVLFGVGIVISSLLPKKEPDDLSEEVERFVKSCERK